MSVEMGLHQAHHELIEHLNAAPSVRRKAEIARRFCADHGFDQFFYGFVSYPEDVIKENAMVHITFPEEVWDLYAEGGGTSGDPIATRLHEIQSAEVMDNTVIARNERFSKHPLTGYFLDNGWAMGVIYPFKSIGGIGAMTAFADNSATKEQANIVRQGLAGGMTGLADIFHESLVLGGGAQQILAITEKERDALAFIASGYTISELSDHLKISERAIEKRLFRARRKLGARNTANAVYRAAVRGVI